MMNELVQIINDAKQFYSQHENEIKLSAVVLAAMALPVYYTVKKAVTHIGKLIDEADAKLTPEQREYLSSIGPYSCNNPFNRFDRFF
jgi:hypothetical protein